MLNNKGFVVSAILYTILLAFLLFLGVTLSIFQSATSTLGNATDDLVNSTRLLAGQVNSHNSFLLEHRFSDINSTEPDYNILVQISSKYGIFYWPRDFIDSENNLLASNGKIGVKCSAKGIDYNKCASFSSIDSNDFKVMFFYVGEEDKEKVEVNLEY